MAKYLITGATGFIGAHLLQKVCSSENEIFCLYRPKKQPPPNTYSIRWIEGDLLDSNAYKEALKESDYVIHLAGLLSARRKEDYSLINVEGTAALLEACKEVGAPLKRFVHMSSVAAGGPNHDGQLLNETDSYAPQTEYGKSKLQAEQVAQYYSKFIPIVILRPTFVYGRGDIRGLKFLKSLNNPVFLLWASQIKTICLCHVTDVVQGCFLSMQKDVESGNIFIISDPGVSIFENVWKPLEEIFCEILGEDHSQEDHRMSVFSKLSSLFNTAASKAGRGQFWACDTSKAQTILGFSPEMPFRKGAYDTILWYISQGSLSIKDIKQIWIGTRGDESTAKNF